MKNFKAGFTQFKKKSTVELILKSTIIIGSIIAIFFLSKIVFPLITGQNLGVSEFGNNLPITNPSNYVVALQINDTQELGKISFKLLSIIFPAISGDKPRCIKNIIFDVFYPERLDFFYLPDHKISDLLGNNLLTFGGSHRRGNPYQKSFAFNQLCATASLTAVQQYELINYEYANSLTREIDINVASNFYFPIDGRYVQSFIWLELDDDSKIAPQIVGLIETSSEWDKKVVLHEVNNQSGDFPQILLELMYFRPIGEIILSIIILLSLLIFIIALLFIDDGSFWEVSIGILLGLWGIQNILVPQNISGPNLIHTTIITFYVIFAGVILLRLFARPIWLKKPKEMINDGGNLLVQIPPTDSISKSSPYESKDDPSIILKKHEDSFTNSNQHQSENHHTEIMRFLIFPVPFIVTVFGFFYIILKWKEKNSHQVHW